MTPKTSSCARGASLSHAFTLIETLVALIIFGIITVAISLAFNTALQTQRFNNRRQAELGVVRSIFDTLTKDLQCASVSENNQSGVFMSGSADRGLLTLTTRSQILQSDSESDSRSSGSIAILGSSSQKGDASAPQSDLGVVRYDFDAQAGTLIRTSSPTPNLKNLQSESATTGTLAKGIVSFDLQYWDVKNSNYKSDWDYEQTNQKSDDSSTSGTSGKTRGLGEGGASSLGQSNSGDSALPGIVKVTLTIRLQDGGTSDYSTAIPIIASQPQSVKAPPLSEERMPPKDSKSSGAQAGG